jgi:hypothetical protein
MKQREMGQAVLVLSSIHELSVKISIIILIELLLGVFQSLQANYRIFSNLIRTLFTVSEG